MHKEDNDKVREEVLKAAEGLTDDLLNRKPAPDEWSPMQVLEHLNLMENYIAKNLSRQIASPTSEKTMKKPIQLTVNRIIKVDAPAPLVPTGDFITLEDMKMRLRESRIFLNSVYDGTTEDVLNSKSMPHPVFGKVPLIQWFPFIGLHEKRHLKQLEKTIEKIKQLPVE